MIADEEFKALKELRLKRKTGEGAADGPPAERSACLVALRPAAAGGGGGEEAPDDRMLISDDGEAQLEVVGTLDLHAARALAGEALIGASANAAYLANVCASPAARRRRVGSALLGEARALARAWGADGLYVHTMAVNEVARGFYARAGFVVECEETSNEAHHRGRCLDGVEGLGRTVLLRDTRLHDGL
jgi:GNAT superfamily N-acetyltransferase